MCLFTTVRVVGRCFCSLIVSEIERIAFSLKYSLEGKLNNGQFMLVPFSVEEQGGFLVTPTITKRP